MPPGTFDSRGVCYVDSHSQFSFLQTEVLNPSLVDIELQSTDGGPVRCAVDDLADKDLHRSYAHARAGRMKGKLDGRSSSAASSNDACGTVEASKKRNHLSPSTSSDNCIRVLDSRRSNYCFFCLKASPAFLIPACAAWNAKVGSSCTRTQKPTACIKNLRQLGRPEAMPVRAVDYPCAHRIHSWRWPKTSLC